jgi:DNA repair protein RadA/Sms
MAKKRSKTTFECQACGFSSAKWLGKCPNCGEWDSFLELNEEQTKFLNEIKNSPTTTQAISITEVEEENITRFPSNNSELDLVLGGGIVPGSLVLIGGSPGVGKSTLLLKIAANIAQQNQDVLYVTGEESNAQVKMRASRLDANVKTLYLLSEIRLDHVLAELSNRTYQFIVIDSIQTLYSENVSSAPGSVSQVREITFELMRIAKERQIAIFIIGHITKEGSIAGPRVLEHMVDVVLYFEGDSSNTLRLLRGFKNRFGATNEVGIFEMSNEGLVSAKNISSKFLSASSSQSGSVLTVILEGSRPIVLEVQALVSESYQHNPKRSSTGFETSRLTMILALLERKLEIPLNQYDVFVNISGGIKIGETAADLAVIAAIISSFRNRTISNETVFIGEVSLTGEVRDVYGSDLRLKEASLQGVKKAIVAKKPAMQTDLKCYEIDEVAKIIDWM